MVAKGSGKGAEKEASFLEGFAGTVGGSFFAAPAWVDKSKPPGHTSQVASIENNPNWRSLLSGAFLFWSPNLVWLLVALFVWFVFPYDFEAGKTWSTDWVLHRLAVNMAVIFGYVGYWHVTLYWLNWGKRPFHPNREWKWSKVIHNVWYTFLGAAQWSLWECIFIKSYATNRLPYIDNETSYGTLWGMVQFVGWFFAVPLYREFHFYFCHRLIHLKCLFKYVHKLHHRNTDIEPFAGLCMHPVEHIYYFSCVGPALYCYATPFAFLWNGIHLVISPAASHSGWEDNFQSDQFHYLHHRFFECNYGTGTFPFDYWFNTMRSSLDHKKDTTYQGEHKEDKENKMDSKAAAIADAKATLSGMPEWDEALFNLLFVVMVPSLIAMATLGYGPDLTPAYARLLAFAFSFGPGLGGMMILAASQRWTTFKRMFLYPFHKEKLVGAFGFNVLIGVAVAMIPPYHMIAMLLLPPGESAYCQLWGGCTA